MADPLYRRIADDLRAQIETGQLEPGAQLPPEEKLGGLFKAPRNTIRDAIKFLISLGLVETRAGQGTFVLDPPDPLVTTLTTRERGLGGGEGAAFEIFRTAFDQNGKPMRVTVTIFPVDRQQFIIDVGEVPAPQFEPAKRPT